MIGYVTLGTNDFEAAARFYDELLSVIGIGRMMEDETFIAWGTGMDKPALSILHPFNKQPATAGNGTMIALVVDSPEKVHAVYDKAIELGAQDEGAAGPRSDRFYAGYFRDLDGNKLNVFCMVGE
ncbi:MAG: VOC family protein [Woeseiaceae bacterium]|nr:VOC family protein [Woeseiaceae bacterium]